MLFALPDSLRDAVIDRLTLLINHVLQAEPVATERLRPHAGRCISLQFDGWPSVLPRLPAVAVAITPAGLLEAVPPVGGADLSLVVDGSNPAASLVQALAGRRPAIAISGDAALAGDVSWLIDNLRWDIEDDVARLVGPAPARELARFGRGVSTALAKAVRSADGWTARSRAAGGVPAVQPPR